MARLPALTPKKLLRILKKHGFVVDHQTGSHAVLIHPDGRRAVVPVHSRDLPRGTALAILKQARVAIE